MLAVLLLALEVVLHPGPHRGHQPQAQSAIEIWVETSSDDALNGSPELWASEGDLGPVQSRRGRGFVALYTPTRDTFPRVVLLSASVSAGRERRRGWLALPLNGSDDLALRTKPDTKVRVQLGGKFFGPVRSDANGNARVHVEVPPGVRLATIHVRDAFGNATSREVDLAPPPFRCVAAIADRDEVDGADPSPVAIEVFAVTPAGRPAALADLKFSAARGAVSLARAERPGVFQLSYRAPEDGGGADTVTVRAFGSSDALRLRLKPGAEPVPPGQGLTSNPTPTPTPTDSEPFRPAQPAAASSRDSPSAFAVGMLLRAQSNLSHANGFGAVLELSGMLPRSALARVGIERLEAIARLEGFAFASRTQPGPASDDPFRRGSLQAFSLASGLRGSVLTIGPLDLHAAALAGALRSFDTVRIVGGPADGVQQNGARWSPLFALAGGASMRLGRGRALAEAQFAFSPARGQLQGNLGGLSFSAGYLLDFN
jgi:hypothetical protein